MQKMITATIVASIHALIGIVLGKNLIFQTIALGTNALKSGAKIKRKTMVFIVVSTNAPKAVALHQNLFCPIIAYCTTINKTAASSEAAVLLSFQCLPQDRNNEKCHSAADEGGKQLGPGEGCRQQLQHRGL